MIEWKITSEELDRRVLKGLRSDDIEDQKEALRLLQGDCVSFSPKYQIEQCLGLIERIEHLRVHDPSPERDAHLAIVVGFATREVQFDRTSAVEVLRDRLLNSTATLPMLQLVKALGPNAYDLRSELIDILSKSNNKATLVLCLEILRTLKAPPKNTRSANTTLNQLTALYRKFDTDNNGTLNADEFRNIPPLNAQFGIAKAWDFKTLDTNGDGNINSTEWMLYTRDALLAQPGFQNQAFGAAPNVPVPIPAQPAIAPPVVR